jgi:hypothetical protein
MSSPEPPVGYQAKIIPILEAIHEVRDTAHLSVKILAEFVLHKYIPRLFVAAIVLVGIAVSPQVMRQGERPRREVGEGKSRSSRNFSRATGRAIPQGGTGRGARRRRNYTYRAGAVKTPPFPIHRSRQFLGRRMECGPDNRTSAPTTTTPPRALARQSVALSAGRRAHSLPRQCGRGTYS